MNDDDDSQLFEGRLEISRTENGSSFGLDEMTHGVLRDDRERDGDRTRDDLFLAGGERGCRLTLFGKTHSFDLVVRVFRSCTMIAVATQPLDGLHCVVPIYEGQDCDAHWSRLLRSLCAVEQIGFFDQHWAAEQGEGDGVEA